MWFKPLRDDLMVQQQVDDAWQHFVGVIMLNQTGRKAVKTTLPEFLYWFPTALALLHADEEFVKSIIQPLGMVNVRYNRLIKMSQDYLTWDGADATMLYGIGKYGSPPNPIICLLIDALSSSGFISTEAARFNLILILFLPLSDL